MPEFSPNAPQTIFSALERIENLATKYGPAVAQGVSNLADIIGGSVPKPESSAFGPETSASHVAARLHRAASLLDGLLSGIQGHAGRIAEGMGVPAPSGSSPTGQIGG